MITMITTDSTIEQRQIAYSYDSLKSLFEDMMEQFEIRFPDGCTSEQAEGILWEEVYGGTVEIIDGYPDYRTRAHRNIGLHFDYTTQKN